MLPFGNNKKKIDSTRLASVVHLAYFIVFEGFGVSVAAFYRRSQRWTELFRKIRKKLNREAVFSPIFGSPARYCPAEQKKVH